MNADETTAGTPSQLGSYRIERVLGRGGMGAVFLAYDTTLHRRVALKMLSGAGAAGESAVHLLREARNAAGLNHPNICTIHEVGNVDGSAFIAMEFVEGRSLRDRIDAGAVPFAEAMSIGAEVAGALAYAHANNVVHRDLKAANIILSDAGRVKIVDFGLARRDDLAMQSTMASAVPQGAPAGTPYAMAPEQVRGDRADARTDVWALGVLLYEMAVGHRPFAAATVPDLFSAILRDQPRAMPGSVPPQFRAIIERCLEKDPAARYQQAADVAAALDQARAGGVTRAPWVRRLWPLAAAIVLLAAGMLAVRSRFTVERVATAPANGAIRLAVLPFTNLTGDPDQEYFVDGLTDEAITQLGRLHPQRLSVIGGTSSMRFKNASMPTAQIGQQLGVEYLLEGSTRREGNRVRVTARLVRAADGTQLWTDVFEREVAGLLTLQRDVAHGVAGSLALALLPEEQRQLGPVEPVDAEAYEAYLRGLGHVSKLSRADIDRALDYFEQALQKDPNFSPAYAGIARVWIGRQQMQFATPREAAPQIRAAVQKGLALNDAVAEIHFAHASLLAWTDWNWPASALAFQRALALQPNHAEARALHAQYLMLMKRPDEGLAEIERALALDPLHDLVQAIGGTIYSWHGRSDEAIALFEKALQTSPRNPVALNGLARAFHHAGRFDRALEAERRLWTVRGDEETVRALGESGNYHERLRRAADIQAARARKTGTAPFFIAIMYLRSGDHDAALDWLERSFDAHDPNVPFIGVGPNWAKLGDHPRFAAVYRKLGLP